MKKWSQLLRALPFLAPNLAGFLVFTLGAVVVSLYLSLTEWDLLTPPRFVGLANYASLLGWHRAETGWEPLDPEFWQACYNTLFMMLGIPPTMLGSFLLACALNQKLAGERIFRLVFFLPSIVAGVAVMLLWKWMFNADYGLINRALWTIFGVQGPTWLTSVAWAKPALMLMGFWTAVGGFNMMLYLAALQNVPKELYEAAEIDGASTFQQELNITLPMLRGSLITTMTLAMAYGMRHFESTFLMTGGGPAYATTTMGIDLYLKMDALRYSEASTAGVFLILMGTVVITALRKIFGSSDPMSEMAQ